MIGKIKTQKTQEALICGKCEIGIVEIIHTIKGEVNTIEIKKCNKCKYQYGLKEIIKADLTEMPF